MFENAHGSPDAPPERTRHVSLIPALVMLAVLTAVQWSTVDGRAHAQPRPTQATGGGMSLPGDSDAPLGREAFTGPVRLDRRFVVKVADDTALATALAWLAERGIAPLDVWDTAVRGFVADLDDEIRAELGSLAGVLTVEHDGQLTLAVDQQDPPWGLARLDQRTLPLDTRYRASATGAGVTA